VLGVRWVGFIISFPWTEPSDSCTWRHSGRGADVQEFAKGNLIDSFHFLPDRSAPRQNKYSSRKPYQNGEFAGMTSTSIIANVGIVWIFCLFARNVRDLRTDLETWTYLIGRLPVETQSLVENLRFHILNPKGQLIDIRFCERSSLFSKTSFASYCWHLFYSPYSQSIIIYSMCFFY
jgi:hypothetical protein